MDLASGTYTVKATADNCEVLTKEITISADTATHMQILALSTKQTDAVTPAGKTDQSKNSTSARTGDSMNIGLWTRVTPSSVVDWHAEQRLSAERKNTAQNRKE